MPGSSFTKGFFVGGLLIASALAFGTWAGLLDKVLDLLAEDDERPPIIVNNNSIDFRALPLKGSTGSWQDKGSSIFWHDYGARRGANFFSVALLVGVDSCKNQAGSLETKRTFEKLESIELNYEDSGNKTVLVDATKLGRDRFVQVTAENATSATVTNDLLKIGGASIVIQSIKLSTNSAQWNACTFAGPLQLFMIQPTKQ